MPDLHRGAALFADNCATCHGESGNGRGPAAASLSTPPVAFTNTLRARKRSLAALEQVITQGIGDTAMPSFSKLPLKDRWALAFYAGHFAFPAADARLGDKLWHQSPALHERVPDLETLATTTPAALGKAIGLRAERARAKDPSCSRLLAQAGRGKRREARGGRFDDDEVPHGLNAACQQAVPARTGRGGSSRSESVRPARPAWGPTVNTRLDRT